MLGIVRFVLLASLAYPLDSQVSGDPQSQERLSRPEQQLLTQYLLQRLLGKPLAGDLAYSAEGDPQVERSDSDQEPSPSIIFSQRVHKPIRRLLDQAKENIDVIDFRKPQHYDFEDHVRRPRQPDDHSGHEDFIKGPGFSAPSEPVPTFLPFPGTEPNRPPRAIRECSDCVNEVTPPSSRFSMPLTKLGNKKYYLGIFFKANWYKAEQYCRYHGMHLASINGAEEQKNLEEHIQSFGKVSSDARDRKQGPRRGRGRRQ